MWRLAKNHCEVNTVTIEKIAKNTTKQKLKHRRAVKIIIIIVIIMIMLMMMMLIMIMMMLLMTMMVIIMVTWYKLTFSVNVNLKLSNVCFKSVYCLYRCKVPYTSDCCPFISCYYHSIVLISTEEQFGDVSGDRMIPTTNVRLWILEILGTTTLPITIVTAPIYEFSPIHHQRIITRLAIIRIVPETTIAGGKIDPTIQTSSARKLFMVSSETNRQPCLTDLPFIFN